MPLASAPAPAPFLRPMGVRGCRRDLDLLQAEGVGISGGPDLGLPRCQVRGAGEAARGDAWEAVRWAAPFRVSLEGLRGRGCGAGLGSEVGG